MRSNWNSDALVRSRLEDHQGFQNWHNGGGLFHKSACIAATAVIEIGAVVHPEAVIGANTHISSGTIVGPSVTIGQSTKLGYSLLFVWIHFPVYLLDRFSHSQMASGCSYDCCGVMIATVERLFF